jgi:integrase
VRTWDKLSATFVRGIKEPGKYGDGGGLLLTVSKAKDGVNRSWLFRYQIDHRERVMGLGPLHSVSLGEARDLAREARRLLARGVDPLEARKAERMAARAAELHTATFKECLDGLIASHGDRWQPKHLAQWKNSMAAYCKPLFDARVSDIDTGMVLRVIEPHWRRAPETLDRVRGRIGEVLGYAQVRGFRPAGSLPTEWKNHLDKVLPPSSMVKPVQHHPALTYADAPALFAKLTAADASIPELCLALTMLTALRSGESRGARRDEFDAASRIWTVPAKRMKEKKEHRVPFSDHALRLVERLPRNGGEHLFAINGNDKPIVAMSLRNALERHAGEGLTVHGLRSTFRTWADEETNYERELKEIALAHAVGDAVERAYARSDMIEKRRRMMSAWAGFLSRSSAAGAEVVPFAGARHG